MIYHEASLRYMLEWCVKRKNVKWKKSRVWLDEIYIIATELPPQTHYISFTRRYR